MPLLNEADVVYLHGQPVDSMWLDGVQVWSSTATEGQAVR